MTMQTMQTMIEAKTLTLDMLLEPQVLWLVANTPETFRLVWDRFKDEPRFIEALVMPIQNDEAQGKCALHALNSHRIESELFLAVLNKCKESPRFIDALLYLPPHRTSLLRDLAARVKPDPEEMFGGEPDPEAFLLIADKLKGAPGIINALLFTPNYGPKSKYIPHSALEFMTWRSKCSQSDPGVFLSWIPFINRIATFRTYNKMAQVLRDILAHSPGVIPSDLPVVKTLVDTQIINAKLIPARNAFFKLLEDCQAKDELTENELNELFETAKKANAAGYVGVYYDLGQAFELAWEYPKALKTYKKIQPTSMHHSKIRFFCAIQLFSMALAETDDNKALRNQYLSSALKWAWSAPESSDRSQLIRNIVLSLVDGRKGIYGDVLKYNLPKEELDKLCGMEPEALFAKCRR